MQGLALAHPADLEHQLAAEAHAHHLAQQQALAGHHMGHDMGQHMDQQQHLDQPQYATQVPLQTLPSPQSVLPIPLCLLLRGFCLESDCAFRCDGVFICGHAARLRCLAL